jgi:hypothetical protein
MSADRLISLGEAREMYGGVSEKTIRRRIAEGKIPGIVKVGHRSFLPLSGVMSSIENFVTESRKGELNDSAGI